METTVPRRLEYFFDYVSPFSFLADSQLPALIERTGAELVYRPMLLGGVMQASGNSPPFSVPAKGAYTAADTARWARRYGLELASNPHFPVKTIPTLRCALVLLEEGGFHAYHQAIFRAMWCEGANVADSEVLTRVLEKEGLDAAHVLERCSEPAIKGALRSNTEEAVERGAFGAPTFFVGDEMFFGNDRLDFGEEALNS
jgi:2-hydroxychromene-2-carboxylate isomerase